MSTPSAASGYDPLVAESFGEFVEFAYQMDNDYPGNLQPPLPDALKQRYELVAYINAIDEFGSTKDTVFYGFALRSRSLPTEIIIAIRGTLGFLEWIIDFEIEPVPSPIPNTGHVEDGFLSIINTMTFVTPDNKQLDRASFVQATLSGLQAPSIVIVGHSLGGALATLFSAEVLYNDPSLQPYTTVYTFASPSVGTSQFAKFYNQLAPQSYRIWNELDIVPRALNLLYTQVNGAGQELKPSWQQLEQYDFVSVDCNHSLMTYLWLLDPTNQFVKQNTCLKANQTAAASLTTGRQELIADIHARRAAGPA